MVEIRIVSEDISIADFEREIKSIEDEHLPDMKEAGRDSIWLTEPKGQLSSFLKRQGAGLIPPERLPPAGKVKVFYFTVVKRGGDK